MSSLVPFEDLGPESSLPVLWHPQLELAHTRDQCPSVIAGTIPLPTRRALSFPSSERLLHLRFQYLLNDFLDERPQKLLLLGQHFFPVRLLRVILLSGHLSFPFFPPLTES